MGLLAGTNYDPGTAASASTASLLAMTALDTTNLRLTFTAPANGSVIMRHHGQITGATSTPQILLGVLDGATVRGRTAMELPRTGQNATQLEMYRCASLITGLTAGTSYTWDAAYGVETVVASTNIKYGGPNNTTTGDAFGGYGFEIWDTPGLLAGTHYDPGTAATASITSGLAMTAFDTTNLRLTFTAPASGNVVVRIRAPVHGSSTASGGVMLLGVLDGATVRGRQRPMVYMNTINSVGATDIALNTARVVVTGLTPGTSYTWDAAYSVDQVSIAGAYSWGGPNNTTADDAYGGFGFDIWDAASVLATGGLV
jgi:hypothetical protein